MFAQSLYIHFQCATLNKMNQSFLHDVMLLIRSTVREVLELPNDIPNCILHVPKMYKDLGITKASWEAYIKHNNVSITMKKKMIHIYRNIENLILK
jgi:hypothetical protein